ncbi:serine O-acetyltransferase [Demequina sp. NBRC 110055]|uniref:serine O-acetyltransferase n=1 Tax=Demequina sp. NBRC 110055 TaxID=1570344 RepID=UPI000A053BE4|nr:DapH/DapD/GlmU-related protein [Demequina sp. NBRC 110055]
MRLPGVPGRLLVVVARARVAIASLRTGITLGPNVAGPGLGIAHHGSVVVNAHARIGSFVRIHSATNIGTDGTGAPVIGSRVYIGPGAVIYGPVHVGDGAVIGANAVVNKDVPPGVTVAGAPAKVISQRGSDAIMPRWWPRDHEH